MTAKNKIKQKIINRKYSKNAYEMLKDNELIEILEKEKTNEYGFSYPECGYGNYSLCRN